MTKRRLLAALTLTALPLVAGTLQTSPIRATADASHERHVTERPSGPRWTYFTGEGVSPLLRLGCSSSSLWGTATCALQAL